MLVALFALLFDFAGVRFCVGVILVRVALVICVACGGRRVCVCGVFVFECAARPFEFVVICVAFALPLCHVVEVCFAWLCPLFRVAAGRQGAGCSVGEGVGCRPRGC